MIMKLAKPGSGPRNVDARLRQPALLPDDSDFEDMGRGLIMSSFERLQSSKKVGKDSSERAAYQAMDEEKNKYKKLKIPRKLSFLLTLVCLIAVAILAYPDSNSSVPIVDAEARDGVILHPRFINATTLPRARTLHAVGTGCRKTGSSMRVELKYSGFGSSVTDCDLPKGATLLGLSQLKRDAGPGGLRIGLVNIDQEQQLNWNQFTSGWGKTYSFPLKPVQKNLKWSDFYPEWIDEDSDLPRCPKLPLPSLEHNELKALTVHVVVVRAPCGQRDVRRLQILLGAAVVASHLAGNEAESMLVLIISECRPLLNLFTCEELLEHKDDLWLFRANLSKLRQRVALPVGSCELSLRLNNSVPLKHQALLADESKDMSSGDRRDAYATLLHSGGLYVCGAIAVAQSIRLSGSKRDLVALVDDKISAERREALQLAGWKLHDIQRIRNPKSEPQKYNAWNYSKFRLWQLVQYDKVVYIDADLLVLQNLDFLFDMPQLSATGNDKSWFNSGFMVIEPSNCTFNLLMDQIDQIESYNGGDQGYLNEIFPTWHRIPRRLNFLKHFWSNDSAEVVEKNKMFGDTDPPLLHVIHYLGRKPWLCYRDYDCNWNTGEYRRYASDVAHARWWKVHDSMAPKLQEQCLLMTKQKASIEYTRRQAEAARFEDEHWKMNITDPRKHICAEKFDCNWEKMLRHWGEPSTDSFPSRRRVASLLEK